MKCSDSNIITKFHLNKDQREIFNILIKRYKTNTKILSNILSYKHFWVRNPFEWDISSINVKKHKISNTTYNEILINFIKHLFCKSEFEIPSNLFYLFRNKEVLDIFIDIFITLAHGKSLFKELKNKNLVNIPITFYSRQQINDFLTNLNNIPINNKQYNLSEEFYLLCFKSFTYSNGGSKNLANLICRKILNIKKWDETSNKYLINLIEWLCKIEKDTPINTKIIPANSERAIGAAIWNLGRPNFVYNNIYENRFDPIIDYLLHCLKKDPNYCFKGRTLNSVQKGMEIWHKELKLEQYSRFPRTWNHSSIKDFEYIVSKNDSKTNSETKTYTITEILSTQELYDEGTELRHCVLSYMEKIHTDIYKSIIWSLKENNKRLATIELIKSGNKIILGQARGFANRLPTEFEKTILIKWFNVENIVWTML